MKKVVMVAGIGVKQKFPIIKASLDNTTEESICHQKILTESG
jgi:hypothetical protein